jgi:hypothetical protein
MMTKQVRQAQSSDMDIVPTQYLNCHDTVLNLLYCLVCIFNCLCLDGDLVRGCRGIDQTEPMDGCYYGIFTAPPAVIASRLPRSPSPFVDYNDFSSKQQSLPSFAVMFSGLSEPDVDFDCSIRQTFVEMSVC